MIFPSYIYDVAVVAGSQVLVLRSNPHNTRPNLLELRELATGEQLSEVSAQAQFANVLAAAGKTAVTGDNEGVLRVWRLADGECLRVIDMRGTAPQGKSDPARLPACAIALLDDGQRALVATGDAGITLWDLQTGQRLRSYLGHEDFVRGIAVVADGARFLSASADRSVRLWNTASGECLRLFVKADLPAFTPRYEAQDAQSATGICVLRDGRRAVSSHGDGMLRCWDIESGELLHEARTASGDLAWLNSVTAAIDADRVIAGSWDNNVWLWSPGSDPVALSGHIGEVMGACFIAGSPHAVSGSFDQTLRLWDVDRRECLRVIGEPIRSSQWPPNESRW